MLKVNRLLAVASTSVLGLLFAASIMAPPSHAAMKMQSSSWSQGKAIADSACAKCHGADEKGRPGFSPGITSTSELKHYTRPMFERLMKTGLDNHGKMVHKPMPTFGYSASKSDKIYGYLKSL